MAQNDFTEDKATLFGAGMVTVGVFGKTALITKGVGVVAATKAGVLAGGFICPPAAICIGLACVGAGLINHFGKRNWCEVYHRDNQFIPGFRIYVMWNRE